MGCSVAFQYVDRVVFDDPVRITSTSVSSDADHFFVLRILKSSLSYFEIIVLSHPYAPVLWNIMS